MFKKIFLSLFLLSAVLLPKVTHGAADLGISINSLRSEENNVFLDLTLQNNSDEFVTNPEYTVQFYKGEKLNESGYLFGGLEYVKSFSGTFENTAPKEGSTKKVEINLPSSIDSGKYFVKVTVSNKTRSHFGASFSETPLSLTGTGGFLGGVNAYMKTPRGLMGLMEGNILNKTETTSVEIPLRENPKLLKYIKDKKINLHIEVVSVNNSNLSFSEDVPLPSPVKDVISIPLPKSFYEKSGAYTVIVNFLDDKNEVISEDLYGRILVGGTSARIEDIQTDTNFYRKNSTLDLKVVVAIGGHTSDEPLKVVAKFKNKEKVLFQKEVTVAPTHIDGQYEPLNADFSSFVSDKKYTVSDIEVQVLDSKGELLAFENHTNDITEKIVGGIALNNYIPIVIAIGLILIALLLVFFYKNRNGPKAPTVIASLIFVVGLVASSFVFVMQNSPQAFAEHPVAVYAKVFSSTTGGLSIPQGDFGSCSVEKNVDVYLEVSCGHCLNINTADLKFFKNYTTQVFTSKPDTLVHVDINGSLYVDGVNQGNAIANDIYGHPIHGPGSNSHLWGPFRLKVGIDKSKLVAPGVYTQNYSIWTKPTPGGFCNFVNEQKNDRSFSCTYITNPTTLTATPSTCGAKIDLAWTPVLTAVGYKVHRSESATGVFREVANVTTLTYTDTAPVPSTKYYYKVTAYAAGGVESDLSTATSAESNSSAPCFCPDGVTLVPPSGVCPPSSTFCPDGVTPIPPSGVCPDSSTFCPDGVTLVPPSGVCPPSSTFCPDGVTPIPPSGVCPDSSTFCPDGVTPIPPSGTCLCPDSSVMPADGKCPGTPPSITTISSISSSCDGTTGTKNTLRFIATSSKYPVTYKIFRKLNTAPSFTEVGTYSQASSGDTNPAFTDKPLPFSRTYNYRVSASNDFGTGPISLTSNVSTPNASECNLGGDGGDSLCPDSVTPIPPDGKCFCPDEVTPMSPSGVCPGGGDTTGRHNFCRPSKKCPDPTGKLLKLNGLLADPTVVKLGETCTIYLRGGDTGFAKGFLAFEGEGSPVAKCTLSGPGMSGFSELINFNPTVLLGSKTGALSYRSSSINGSSIFTLNCTDAGINVSASAVCRLTPKEVEVSFLEKVLKTSSRLKDGLLGAVLFSMGAK